MILKYALDSNDAGDIHIGLVKDGTTLVSPAFATLQKSRKINKELFEEAKYYMFSKNFRFIFDSRPLASHVCPPCSPEGGIHGVEFWCYPCISCTVHRARVVRARQESQPGWYRWSLGHSDSLRTRSPHSTL
ncbi:hypothetical protein DPSP01_008448 [Paraphaeosphaeria sporulosa]